MSSFVRKKLVLRRHEARESRQIEAWDVRKHPAIINRSTQVSLDGHYTGPNWQGIDLCARLLFDRGDNVIVENPGYPGAIRTFKAYGAVLKPAAVDCDGIVCRDLADDARVVYVTPSHQYPTGVSMSLNRRLEILAWARRRSAVIIEDDYDSEYRYSGSPLPALQGLAEEVPVIYCGTFSKVMFPGLRIGYLVLPETLVPTFTRAKRLL